MSDSSNLGASIRKGSAWLFFGSTGNQVINFLVGIVLARLLAPADFGMLATISIFTGIAGYLAGGGMGQALVRAKEATKQDYDIVFTLQLIFGCLIYAIFFFSAPWFAEWYKTPLYADLLRVAALSFIFRPFANLPGGILHRDMRFKAKSAVAVIALVVTSAVSVGMAYAGYGVWSLIAGGVAGSIVNMMLLIPLANWRPGFSLDVWRGRDIARYGFLTSLNDIVDYLRNQASVFILSRTLGIASVGLYNKGSSLAGMPHAFITTSVYQVLFRALAAEQGNLDKSRYLFYRSIALVAVYATPFYVGLLWIAEPLVRGLYGPKWLEAASPLFILSFAWPFMLINNLSGAVLAARNWLNRELMVQISNLIITCLAVLIGLPHGISGVACSMVGVSAFSATYMYWLASSSLKARWSDYPRALLPAAILNVILASVLFLVDYLLPAKIHESDFAYLACMGITGALIYALSFLYLPISALQSERQRWKIKFHLPG